MHICKVFHNFGSRFGSVTKTVVNRLFSNFTHRMHLYPSAAILLAAALTAQLFSPAARAQDPQFSQFYANHLYLNPAFAGSARCPRFSLNYRNQWPAISGNFVTYSASYDQHIDAIQGGIGVNAFVDMSANNTLRTTYVGAMYSYLLNINRKLSMRFGLQGSYGQRNIDWSRLTFGDQIDARYGFIYNTQEQRPLEVTRFFDVNAGAIIYSDKFYGGVAVHHCTQPNEGFLGVSRLPLRITAHAGAVFALNQRSKYVSPASISPNILFMMQQNFRQLNLGFYATKGVFVGGLWYRNLDAFILLAGIQKNNFKVGYSYDFTISRLTNRTGGAHEVSMGFIIPCKPPIRRFRTVRCPSF